MVTIRPLGVVAAAAILATSGACGSSTTVGRDSTAGSTLLVFAAASLTDAMGEVEVAFESDHPHLDVELNLAGSASLRAQILAGAPADVVASAHASVMDDLVAAGVVAGDPTTFATNRMTIATAEGNPAGITGLADFARSEPYLGLCAADVPCGDLADEILDRAGITPDVDTREPDVRALLIKIETGELDGGLVYATDVVASDRVDEVALPVAASGETGYPVAVLTGSTSPAEARSFVEFLTSARGRSILADAGFGTP